MKRRKNVTIDIMGDKCSGCGRCAAICPQNIFTIKKVDGKLRSISVWSAKCKGCGRCTVICPERAISLEINENNYIPAFI